MFGEHGVVMVSNTTQRSKPARCESTGGRDDTVILADGSSPVLADEYKIATLLSPEEVGKLQRLTV